MRCSLLLALVGVMGCQSENTLQARTAFDVWYQEPTDQVDILWVIDNSNSMRAEQETLAAGFSSFALELENTGTDFHLGVITTTFDYEDPNRGKLIGEPPVITRDDDYLNIFPNRVQVGLEGGGKEKGLEAAAWALSSIMTTGNGPNAGFLRPEAQLLVVFVSDEDDCSDDGALNGLDNVSCYREYDTLVPVAEYVSDIEQLKVADEFAGAQLAAIVGPEVSTGCLDAVPGLRYIEAARLTGGLVGDICKGDWSGVLYDLGLNAVGIHNTFELSHGAVEGTLVVKVDDIMIPEDPLEGFTYDVEFYTVTFNGNSVPERGSVIEAEYTVLAGT
jgi:hypothetical protein